MIVGSGPIVIGQACEFDYSGTQACKALKEEGYEVVLLNSNPATVMTDPDFADRTYIEPITPEVAEQILAREKPDVAAPHPGRPDRAQPGGGAGQERRAGPPRGRAHRRLARGHREGRGPAALQGRHEPHRGGHAPQRLRHHLRGGPRGGRADRLPGHHPPQLHHGWRGRRRRLQQGGVRRAGPPRHRPLAHPHHPRGGVDPRLEGVRARGDAGPERQRGDRLQHRELRSHGRPHRRLHHRGPGPDPLRQGVPAPPRRCRSASSARSASTPAGPTSSSACTPRPAGWWSSR